MHYRTARTEGNEIRIIIYNAHSRLPLLNTVYIQCMYTEHNAFHVGITKMDGQNFCY